MNTPQGAIVGATGPFESVPWSNRADIIAIEGDEAKILKSGVDFDNLEPF
ncbi:hypothetical protein [Burkholderia pseudomallei]|nr:hypothetical protein [Burkholderia pseudomallei]MBM5617238.1 hypothetical protein [Burkholderia pseudomallei]MBM5629732.1 hypothetical protein [Burkholderia pseudomallei]MBM5658031.1 hypothetical protein [Burkholderia pseudomallei]